MYKRQDKKVTLMVSYIGYTSQEVVATPGKPMSIILKVDNNLLDEVIVTGYGTFKKSAYAGSASIVKTDAVKDVPNVSFQQMLEGAAPGVSVNTGSGIPGLSLIHIYLSVFHNRTSELGGRKDGLSGLELQTEFPDTESRNILCLGNQPD